MSAAESRLAAIIAEHRVGYDLVDETLCCDCGDRWTLGSTEALRAAEDAHIRHVAAVIASSDDLAVIELPKPTGQDDFGAEWNGDKYYVFVEDGEVTVAGRQLDRLTPDEAEVISAAILAAAKAAEGVARDGE